MSADQTTIDLAFRGFSLDFEPKRSWSANSCTLYVTVDGEPSTYYLTEVVTQAHNAVVMDLRHEAIWDELRPVTLEAALEPTVSQPSVELRTMAISPCAPKHELSVETEIRPRDPSTAGRLELQRMVLSLAAASCVPGKPEPLRVAPLTGVHWSGDLCSSGVRATSFPRSFTVEMANHFRVRSPTPETCKLRLDLDVPAGYQVGWIPFELRYNESPGDRPRLNMSATLSWGTGPTQTERWVPGVWAHTSVLKLWSPCATGSQPVQLALDLEVSGYGELETREDVIVPMPGFSSALHNDTSPDWAPMVWRRCTS